MTRYQYIFRFFILTLLFGEILYGDEILIPDCSFRGEQNAGRIGYYLSPAGDVNNDGFGDFMIGSYHTSLYGWNSGAAFLVLGKDVIDWQLNTSLDIAAAVFRGKAKYEMVGYNIAGEGDFNGDGIDDMIIGGPGNWEKNPPIPGSAYIVFGRESADWGDDFILSDQADFEVVAENILDQLGYASTFIGDINEDGCDDILCAASFRTQTREWEGKVYLILGRRQIPERVVNVNEVAVASFIYPEYHGVVGSAVEGVGDVNQDGYPDFVIGAAGIGKSFLLLGRPQIDYGFDFHLQDADCIFYPEKKQDDAGWQVKKAGDLNHDGYPDFLISGLQIKWEAGKVYAIFGRKNWPSQGLPLSQADASYYGEGTYHHAGVGIGGIHDFSGDGIDDFVIGARYYKHTNPGTRDYHRGKVYLIKGKKQGWSRDVPLKNENTYFLGEDSVACTGWDVCSIGDVNGDMRMDFVVSAPWHDDGRTAGRTVGEIYMFLADYPLRIIGGKTLYFSGDLTVPNVQMTLGGDVESTALTDGNGAYLFELSHGSNFTMAPFKPVEDNLVPAVISIYDAALTARHSVKLDTLGKYAQISADIDNDGLVTTYDASLIAHYAVNLWTGEDDLIGTWRFDPEEKEYNSNELPLLNENYFCMLVGDVSGNWRPDAAVSVSKSVLDQEILLPGTETISVPFYVAKSSGMLSAEIRLSYNSEILELLTVKKSDLTSAFQLIVNDKKKNEVITGLYGLEKIDAHGIVCYVDFKKRSPTISKTKIRIDRFQINDEAPETGEIFFRSPENEPDVDLAKQFTMRNYPNPFNPETIIQYQLKEKARVELIILNSLGHRVRVLESGVKEAGEHLVIWKGNDDGGNRVGSGLYISLLKTDKYSIKRKMLKLK